MLQVKFTKKTKIILRAESLISRPEEILLDGYTSSTKGFPFGIVKRDLFKKKYWIIVNRFSGKPFLTRFSKKREAEDFFETFMSKYNIDNIDFKDPHSNFNYRIASFAIRRLMAQKNYRKRNFGDTP